MSKQKPRKLSLIDITNTYHNNEQACYKFFFDAKYPDGYFCEKCGCTQHYKIIRHRVCQCKNCGHQEYLFAGTIFQNNKLDLFKLILGLYIFFSSNKGVSAVEMANQLDVNRKTAQLLCRKCRILMAESNASHKLNEMFYEADTAYIGAKSEEKHSQGCGTEQRPFLALLSTGENNNYPRYVKLYMIPKDNGEIMNRMISKSVVLGKERILNTDGKNTFYVLKDSLTVNAEKIIYSNKDHRLRWLNIIIGNIKNHIVGIYHGVTKRDLQLFLQEQEYRFNHRYIGNQLLSKIQKYITNSSPYTRKNIQHTLDICNDFFQAICA